MATKDWHKNGKDSWMRYTTNGRWKIIYVKYNNVHKNYYVFGQNTGLGKHRKFKTKTQALKYAKLYMMKH